ncbi:MAG: hypothetical protein JO257_22695 [Deltaproteobacteria bacterium]|nr:hypothetical protein [Deltaproteobacteria bacterium]
MKRALFLLAACGGGGHHTTDAPPYDAPADTLPTSADAAQGGITLRVLSGGDPVPNVATIFLDAQDKQVAAVTTDQTGTAAATLTAGGTVTAIVHEGTGLDHLTTFTGVQPGDVLLLELQPAGPAAAMVVNLTFPTNGSQAYTLFPSCGDQIGSTDGTFQFRPLGCGGTADFVVGAGAGGTISSFLVAMGVNVGSDAVVAGTFAPPITPAYNYTAIPSTLSALSNRAAILGHNGEMYAQSSSVTLATNQTTATLHETIPTTMTPALVTTNLWPQPNELGQQLVVDAVADASADYNLDVTQAMLPRYITAPAYDVVTRSIGWGEAPATAQSNVVRAQIHVNRDDVPAGRSWTWTIAAPKNAASVTFPALPAVDGFSFIPIATDTVVVSDLTTALFPGGFDALRTSPFRDLVPALTSGHAVIETLAPPQL